MTYHSLAIVDVPARPPVDAATMSNALNPAITVSVATVMTVERM